MAAHLRRLLGALLLVAGAAHAQTWHDTLRSRDVNHDGTVDAYYDIALDVTWLKDFTTGGATTWSDASSQAAAFSSFGTTGWRLPALFRQVDWTNVHTLQYTDSELGHLYAVTLGLPPSGCAVLGCQTSEMTPAWLAAPFRGITVWDNYIVDAVVPFPDGLPPNSDEHPWVEFSMGGWGNGHGLNSLPTGMLTFVHDGDVFASVTAIPEPSTYALMAIGLLGIAGAARRRHRALQGGGRPIGS